MYSYQQSTGILSKDGVTLGIGYSGCKLGLNNPAMQDVANVGPCPQGLYTIGPDFTDPEKGPIVMHLVPDSANQMFGRSAFMLHGDNMLMNHSASEGCIILDRALREIIATDTDKQLTVVK